MNEIVFKWDSKKALSNTQKHGVSFDEAKSVFFDENALVIPDLEHSNKEERFIILGLSHNRRLLVVCHCYREADHIIRLISARKATRQESKQYRGDKL
ncbi:MAG: BrnT family toxin [Gammaproteobacteria bacterium]|nr:BrnT family toxin [Gammaproteobacteria bacterium]